jgi:hypothetical protein
MRDVGYKLIVRFLIFGNLMPWCYDNYIITIKSSNTKGSVASDLTLTTAANNTLTSPR